MYSYIAPPPAPPPGRLRARVSYLGTNYHGWQYQLAQPTVQATLEAALTRRFKQRVRVVAASRTDSGVHARGQAVHFDVPNACRKPLQEDDAYLVQLQHSLNQLLPTDVRVRAVARAPPNHPRVWSAIYNATGKLYTYRFSIGDVFDPLQRPFRHHEWRARKRFDLDDLRRAAVLFEGRHDFSAFTNSAATPPGVLPPVLVNPVREIHSVSVIDEGDACFRIEFLLNGALYRMVRNIVGTMLDVAVGRCELAFIHHLFEMKDRQLVGKSAPAEGLCLEHVYYDDW